MICLHWRLYLNYSFWLGWSNSQFISLCVTIIRNHRLWVFSHLCILEVYFDDMMNLDNVLMIGQMLFLGLVSLLLSWHADWQENAAGLLSLCMVDQWLPRTCWSTSMLHLRGCSWTNVFVKLTHSVLFLTSVCVWAVSSAILVILWVNVLLDGGKRCEWRISSSVWIYF